MFLWPLQSLVPLCKVLACPSFPGHVCISLGRFEGFLQVMDGFNGAFVFFRPSKKWFGVSAISSSGSSLTAVRGLALSVCSTRHVVVLSTPSLRLRLSNNAIMTFLRLWISLSQISPKCGAPGELDFQTFLFCAKSLSILAFSHSFINAFKSLAAPMGFVPLSLMMVFLQWILSLQLEMTRCPMILPIRCVLLWFLEKWRGSAISSKYVVGNWIRRVRSSRLRYGSTCSSIRSQGRYAMGGWIWLAFLCLHLIHLDLIFLKLFSIRWSSTLVGACFSHILCPRMGYHDALFQTEVAEVVHVDVLLSIVLDVRHCNRDLNVSVDLSLELFHLLLWRVIIWQRLMFWRFPCCLL